MRKLGVLLVVSILLFVFGVGTFVYEFSQISPHQMDLSQETQTMTTSMPNRARLYTKTYLSSVGVSLWMKYSKMISYKMMR